MSGQESISADKELASALRNYLPSSLARQCLLGDEIKVSGACLRHLDALLRTISTYLPRQVVVPLLAEPTLGRVEGDFVHGTVMFADISGFTALSETLSQLGKAGAEEITSIINRFFTALLEVAEHYGGDLLKFGGDALLLFFGGERAALRACRAALHIQETMARFSETTTSQGVFRLRMSVGIGTGPLFMARLGSVEGMEFTVMGQAMTQMAQAESQASAGQIFIDAETQRAVGDEADTRVIQDSPSAVSGQRFYQLLGFRKGTSELVGSEAVLDSLSAPPVEGDRLLWVERTVKWIDALALFLPPGLMDRIKFDPERMVIGGEYRPVAIFFANFYGINDIIAQLGREHSAEITAILNAHFARMRRAIAKYGGVVNKVDTYAVGHRIMALFGAPRAHIDDPERAARAALEMQDAMVSFAELDTSCGTFSLKQRIGVNTGLVFAGNVGSPTRQEYSVMGDEVNLAARLMGVATEGQVLISQSTLRQSGDAFLLHEQEPMRVKGKSQPVPNYSVMGVREHRVRTAYRRPLVGRDEEWERIHALSERALDGEPQVLTVVGDVGLGKSRFLEELSAHWVEEHGALHIGTSCPSFGRHTPYLPWLELLRPLFGFNPADTAAVRLEKIEALLVEIDSAWRDWTALIGRLLGLDVEETPLIRSLDAQTRQRIIFRVVAGLVDHIAGEQPLLLVIDDLQWADEVSVELVNHVAHQISGRPLLLLLAHRPEEGLALDVADLSHHTELRLRELSDEAGLRLLDILLPTTPQMPQRLKELILQNAQGNPLFIEEVARALIENYLVLDEESGTYRAREDLEQIEVPDTVNRVIMSRMDRLDEGSRNVLKVASAIGKEFRHWLLRAIYPYRRGEGELRERLDALSRREILEGPYAELLYLFRHIMTREVAYESMLYADRRQLHCSIGESIETQRAGRLAEYWEVLAYHFRLAEEWGKALDYHLKAGRRAQEVYANEDALHHYRQALKAAGRVMGSGEQQLEAREGLAEVLDTLGRYDDALGHFHQAQDLVVVAGFSSEDTARRLADLCRKIAAIHEKESDYDTAFEWLRGGLKALEGMETIEAARVYLLGAGIYQRQGKNEEAVRWCQRSLGVASRITSGEGQQAMAHAYYNLGGLHIRLGDLARAVQFCRDSLQIYQDIGDAVGQSQAHLNLANAYFEQGDWPRATEHYLRALEIKRKIGDVYHQGFITVNLGGVYLKQGDLDRAIDYYEQSMEMWRELGSTYVIALLHNNMGAVALRRGDPDEALELLQKSLTLFHQIESKDFLPEVYRNLAETHLNLDQIAQAEEWAGKSLELARAQEMKLEEGTTRRVVGQIHRAQSEWDAAAQELETSLNILEELDSQYEVGQTLFQLAQLQRDLSREGRFHETCQRVIDIFERLGARLDLERARALENIG